MTRRCLYLLMALVLAASTAQARVMAPPPIPDRVVKAQAIVVGKVTAVEEKTVSAGGQEYQIAVVQVEEALLGAKGLTHVRVGFLPQRNPRFPQLNLTVGQESCFFLSKPAGATFYTTPAYFDVIDKKNANFANEVALIRRCGKLIGDTKAGLASKEQEDRLLTVAMLLARYRVPPPGSTNPPKLEPIDAEESKLILLTLAGMDWSKSVPNLRVEPASLFYRLGVTPKDGFTPPKDFKELPDAAKKWLKDNADKYRIQRFVAEAPKKN